MIWPSLGFPTLNSSVSGVSYYTSQEQDRGEAGRGPRVSGDCRGLESGHGNPKAQGGCSSVSPGPGTGGHVKDWPGPVLH